MSSFNWKNEDNTNDPKYSNHLANLVRQTIIIILIVIIAVIMIIITLKMIITVVTMIKNKDYAACVRRESGYCEVEWTTATPYDQQVNFLSNRHFVRIRVTVVMIAMITDNHCHDIYSGRFPLLE